MTKRHTHWLLVLVIVTAILPYASALRLGFIYDDHLQIEENPYLRAWPGVKRVFTSDVWSMTSTDATSNYYRPLMWISYKLIFSIAGSSPWPFHLLNILLHGAVTATLFVLTLHLWNDVRIATIAALLFAVHPAHVEPVVWIAALPELGYSLFFLLGLYFYVRDSPVFLACYAISLLWKESAITFLPCVVLFDAVVSRQIRVRRYAALAIVSSLYLALRYVALGGLAPRIVHSGVSMFAELLTAAANIATYLAKLVFPVHLSFFYPVTFVTAIDLRIVAVLVLLLGAVFVLRGKVAWAALWTIVALLPALVTTRVAVPLAERNLYLASVGFVWLAAELLVKLPPRKAVAALCMLVVASTALEIGRIPNWHDDLTLWQHALQIYPQDRFIRLNIASEFGRQHLYDDALNSIDEILKHNGRDLEALTSRAGILVQKQDWPKVADTCRQVFTLDPNSARCSLAMGIVAHERGQMEVAKQEFDRAYRNNPLLWQALFHQANLAAEMRKLPEAIQMFEQVIKRNPSAPVFNNLGSAYAEMGESQKAASAFDTALSIDPSFDLARQNRLRITRAMKTGRN